MANIFKPSAFIDTAINELLRHRALHVHFSSCSTVSNCHRSSQTRSDDAAADDDDAKRKKNNHGLRAKSEFEM